MMQDLGMPLRTPKFLDTETFFALAEYAEVQVPLQQEITERTVKNRKGGGKVGLGKTEVGGERGTEVEIQTSYTLAPNQKAAVSRCSTNSSLTSTSSPRAAAPRCTRTCL
ncbi:hypothetical protein [Cellulosimicrobium protaetiae]